jgi:large subunit ribosomal protein L24
MNRPKFKISKGDRVSVISGKHKGASGKVLQVIPKKLHVLIEGIRLVKKHVRKSQDNPQGAIIEREGPIHISNIKLLASARGEAPTAPGV